MDLIFGAHELDRRIPDVEQLLRDWRVKEADFGQLYLDHQSATSPDRIFVEDLAVTMLINSRVDARQAMGIVRNAEKVDLSVLPRKSLAETTADERQQLAELIAAMTSWPGFGASVATKLLHKKRPELIPVLDNMAIFGAYMNRLWPERAALADTVKAVPRIREALDWIVVDITRTENEQSWERLQAIEAERTRIELFDIVWWMHFSPLRGGTVPA
jgi:hypothetical protein